MAVLGRLLLGSAERLDLPDLLSIDSFTGGDFKYLIQSLIGADSPYILRGFDVIQPQDSIGTESISIRIADSVAYYPTATAGSFFYGLEEGNANAQALVPDLRKNATNFVYLNFTTFDTAQDSRAFWDPDQNGGAGGEFSQDINTESALTVEVGVSVSTFPENTIPIAKVVVGPSVITSIEDSRDLMFRLGTGGTSPDPFSTFDFRNDPTSAYQRDEPSTIMTSPLDANPFQGGDKNIFTLKEWMDVVMSIVKEITGGTYWYSAAGGGGGGVNLPNIWEDALGSTLKSKGEWIHDELVGGRVTWTEDVAYHSLTDPRELIIRANTVDIANNDEVAYIELVRGQEINGTATPVNFLGTTEVTGASGAFANLSKGDWIKKVADNDYLYLRVEEFYTSPGFVGISTPALAESIRLSDTYAGVAGTGIAEYTKGEYLLTDIQVEPRDTSVIDNLGGNFFWLAYRSDTNLGLEGAIPTQLSIDITEADGIRAKCTSAAHGLIDGDRIEITTGTYAAEHQVSVEDANVFYINTATTGDELAQTAFYAIVETRARNTGYTYELESANHGFESGQRITLQNTLSAYNGSYLINKRSDTTFQIPIASLIANPGNIDGEIVSLARINVKTEFGLVKVVQGESINIGDPETANIVSYLGMPSLAASKPVYNLPLGYNALNGQENYNSDTDDDITVRVSKLTAMMADRVQDRGFNIRGRVNITSTTNGLNQDITSTGALTLHKPSSDEQVINLAVSLPANSAAVATIDRDGSTAINLSVVSLDNSLLLGENDIIMFYRFAGTTVYTWKDEVLEPAGHINTQLPEDSSNRNVSVLNPGCVDLNTSTGLVNLNMLNCIETSRITVNNPASTLDVVGDGLSWTLFSANDATDYYIWYDVTDGANAQSDPGSAGTAIKVDVLSADTSIQVATKTSAAINLIADFNSYSINNGIFVENTAEGNTTNTADVDTSYIFTTLVDGQDPDIEIIINGSTDRNTVDVTAINTLGTLIAADNSAIWVRVNRFGTKTFNQVLTADAPSTIDTDIAGALFVTPISDVPLDQDVFVLWMRDGDNLIEMHRALPSEDPSDITPLKMTASVPEDLVLNIGSITTQNKKTGIYKTIPTIDDVLPTFAGGTVTVPATSGGTVTVSPGTNSILTVSSNNYIKMGIYIDNTGQLSVLFGTESASIDGATAPIAVKDTFAIGYLVIQNLNGNIQTVSNKDIFQYAGGGGGNGGDSMCIEDLLATDETIDPGVTCTNFYLDLQAGSTLTLSSASRLISKEPTINGTVVVEAGSTFEILPDNSPDWVYSIIPQILSPYTALNRQILSIDTTNGPTTVNLPASPEIGDEVEVRDHLGTFSSGNLTVEGNGNTINGNANVVFSTDDVWAIFYYNGSEYRIKNP